MSPQRQKFAALIVAVASRLVPRGQREEWRREWSGELWSRGSSGGPVVTPALGAIRHALWLRRRAAWYGSSQFARDLRYAVRSLSRRPLFALSSVATLALGLGATTAVYSVVDTVLLAPLPYPGAERLALLQEIDIDRPDRLLTLSPETFTAWRDGARAFEVLEGYTLGSANLVGAGPPAVVGRARVTPGFLSELLGVEPLLGRSFPTWAEAAATSDVALISESLWRAHFDGRSDVLGRTLRVDGRSMEVIGVLPALSIVPGADVWIQEPLDVDHERTRVTALVGIGRLRPGVSLEAASADLASAAERGAEVHPTSLGRFRPALSDLRIQLVSDVRAHLLLLMGAVAAVLLIACVNVTNLLLVRGLERSQELAVRRSLGAGTGQLATHVIAESLILAGAGGLLGLGLALVGVDTLLTLLPAEFPLASAIRLDGRVLAFAALATLGAAVLVGLLPTWRASRAPTPALRRAHSSGSRDDRRAGKVLLGLEVAQAGALLVAAGLMINTLWRMSSADAGFEPDGLVFVHLNLPAYDYAADDGPGRRAGFLETLRARLIGIPEVQAVGLGSATPFSGATFKTVVEIEGSVGSGVSEAGFARLHVDLDYLSTLGLAVLQGRGFQEADYTSGEPVALVNATAARSYWPGQGALGSQLVQGNQTITIVGVVADFGHPGLPTRSEPELYQLLERGPQRAGSPLDGSESVGSITRPMLLVRHSGRGEEMVELVKRAVWAVDPELPIPAVATAEHELGASLATTRFYTLMLGLFASLALALASVGIYGVVASSVARRTREIGIRIALGAEGHSVLSMVAREGMAVVLPALAIGLGAGALASQMLESLLYGVTPTDLSTYAGAAALLAGVAAVAILIPARRVLRANPTEALRSE